MSFPLRVACVDMGSNAIRFLAAEFSGPNTWENLTSERRPVRLGQGVHLSGRLDPGAMDAAVQALTDFRGHMDRLGISQYRAAATSAVRESKNGSDLVKRVDREAGIRLEVISGSEEAHLVHRAVARHVVLGDDQWILADLGGGSVEVSLVDRGGILWSESHTMGSVRLLEELTEASSEPGRFLRLLTEYTQTLNMPSGVDREALGGYIATGGNIESLAQLAGTKHRDGVDRLSTNALRMVIERLAQLSFRERVESLGLREDRADVILPAAMVYERLAELADTREILVPHVGIKEGILYDLVDRLTSRSDHGSRRIREVEASALALGRKYLFDEEHAVHVADLACSLFEQLAPLHQLDESNRKILRAAALLHDIGQFVSYKGHHKHTLYLVSHSELPTFSAREMLLVANVGRYHRKAEPSAHHSYFTQLSKPERERVRRLAAILRVADALDREHVQRVPRVTARIAKDNVILILEGEGDLILESWALRRKSQFFARIFGKKITLRFAGEPEPTARS